MQIVREMAHGRQINADKHELLTGKRLKQDLEIEVSDWGICNISPGLKVSGSNL